MGTLGRQFGHGNGGKRWGARQLATWAGRGGSPVTGSVKQGVTYVQLLVTSLPTCQVSRKARGWQGLWAQEDKAGAEWK